MTNLSPDAGEGVSGLDTTVAHSARLWNYLLGGKDNFAADREAAEPILAFMPELVQSARYNREFLGRVVQFLAMEARVDQFLDIGTGLPTANNTHHLEPGLVTCSQWRPDGNDTTPVTEYCAVGRKR